jgi:hypothetical protein
MLASERLILMSVMLGYTLASLAEILGQLMILMTIATMLLPAAAPSPVLFSRGLQLPQEMPTALIHTTQAAGCITTLTAVQQ